MKHSISKQEHLEQHLLALINACRGRVLDIVEAQLGSSSNWRIVRGQLLNLLGEKGLSGDIQKAVSDDLDCAKSYEQR